MKPDVFQYHRAVSVEDACRMLRDLGDDARILAGGQSLLPMMNFRIARPRHVIDVTGIKALGSWRVVDKQLRIGAAVTHRAMEKAAPRLPEEFRHFAAAMKHLGHLPIRTRGTIGGSLAHGDKTAEWVQLAIAHDAQIVLQSVKERRCVPAAAFFLGPYLTDMQADEVLTEIVFPVDERRGAIAEYARRHGDYAVVSSVALHASHCAPSSIVVTGPTPACVRVPAAEEAWRCGGSAGEVGVAAASAIELDAGDLPEGYARGLVMWAVERAVQLSEGEKNG